MTSWYPRYTGDYARDTGHLTLVEHGAYCCLLDQYYSSRKPLPADKARLYRMARAFTEEERQAVDVVVDQFFELKAEAYHSKRCDKELLKLHDKAEEYRDRAKNAAKHRWSREKEQTHSETRPEKKSPPASNGWVVWVDGKSKPVDLVKNLMEAFPSTTESHWAAVVQMAGDSKFAASVVSEWLVDVANSIEMPNSPVAMLRGKIRKAIERRERKGGASAETTI